MNVVPIKKKAQRPASGSAMDRALPRRGLSRRLQIGTGAALLVALALAAWLLVPAGTGQTVQAGRLSISPGTGTQSDGLPPLRAHVAPTLSVDLDAGVDGRLERDGIEGLKTGNRGVGSERDQLKSAR